MVHCTITITLSCFAVGQPNPAAVRHQLNDPNAVADGAGTASNCLTSFEPSKLCTVTDVQEQILLRVHLHCEPLNYNCELKNFTLGHPVPTTSEEEEWQEAWMFDQDEPTLPLLPATSSRSTSLPSETSKVGISQSVIIVGVEWVSHHDLPNTGQMFLTLAKFQYRC